MNLCSVNRTYKVSKWIECDVDASFTGQGLTFYGFEELTILTACFYLDWSFNWIVLFDTEIVDDISGPNILRHHTSHNTDCHTVTCHKVSYVDTITNPYDALLSIIYVQVRLNQSLVKKISKAISLPISVTSLLSSAWDRLWPHAASHRSLSLLWWWWLGMSQSWAGPLWPGKIRP